MTPAKALQVAIKEAGGTVKVAAALRITSQAVSQWRECPDRRVLALEALCGKAVTRQQLRPDLYPVGEAA